MAKVDQGQSNHTQGSEPDERTDPHYTGRYLAYKDFCLHNIESRVY